MILGEKQLSFQMVCDFAEQVERNQITEQEVINTAMQKGATSGLSKILRHLIRKKVDNELLRQEEAVVIPSHILRDKRPVKSLKDWAKIVEQELIVV